MGGRSVFNSSPARFHLVLISADLFRYPVPAKQLLGYVIKHKERLAKSELGGGALLDLGVYPINFALMVFGEDYRDVSAQAVLSDQSGPAIPLRLRCAQAASLHILPLRFQ